MNESYVIRDFIIDDANLILSSFLKGLYYGNSWFNKIPKDIFMGNYKLLARQILANPRTVVKIACLPDDPSIIIGYSILSSDYQAIVWVFVKKQWRNLGIAKALVPAHPLAVTHLTGIGETLLKEKLPNTIFNPFYPI